MRLLLTKVSALGGNLALRAAVTFKEGEEMMGAASIQWSESEQSVMVQAYEVRRFGLLKDKYRSPEQVKAIRQSQHLKGFKRIQHERAHAGRLDFAC